MQNLNQTASVVLLGVCWGKTRNQSQGWRWHQPVFTALGLLLSCQQRQRVSTSVPPTTAWLELRATQSSGPRFRDKRSLPRPSAAARTRSQEGTPSSQSLVLWRVAEEVPGSRLAGSPGTTARKVLMLSGPEAATVYGHATLDAPNLV